MSYAMDCSDPECERIYTRPVTAEMLIDTGATVDRETWDHLIRTGASGMLHLLARKNALMQTLPFSPRLNFFGQAEGYIHPARCSAIAFHRRRVQLGGPTH
jgi:hypothetical protein